MNEHPKRNTEEMPKIKNGGKTANEETMQNDQSNEVIVAQLVVCV